jgi:hypothetical protein
MNDGLQERDRKGPIDTIRIDIVRPRHIQQEMTVRVPLIRPTAAKKLLRAKSNLLNRFNLIWVVQPALQKFPASHCPQISGYFRAVPSRQEGRIAIVTNARRDVVDAAASARKVDAGRGKLVSVHVAQDVRR